MKSLLMLINIFIKIIYSFVWLISLYKSINLFTLWRASSSNLRRLSTLLRALLLDCDNISDSIFLACSLAFSYSCCLVTYSDWAFRKLCTASCCNNNKTIPVIYNKYANMYCFFHLLDIYLSFISLLSIIFSQYYLIW